MSHPSILGPKLGRGDDRTEDESSDDEVPTLLEVTGGDGEILGVSSDRAEDAAVGPSAFAASPKTAARGDGPSPPPCR